MAKNQLSKAGAAVTLTDYAGGHGWQGDVFGNIRSGIEWLEQPAATAQQK
jgi:predicted esterase